MHIFPRRQNDGFSWNFNEENTETLDMDFKKLKNEIKELTTITVSGSRG